LVGGQGNDILAVGLGNDTLWGNGGADNFVIGSFNEDLDRIRDFETGIDHIAISAAGFGAGLVGGTLQLPEALDASQFVIGNAATATTTSQLFIFDTNTNILYFDQDGSDAGFTQVQLVGFDNLSTLFSANDFSIIT